MIVIKLIVINSLSRWLIVINSLSLIGADRQRFGPSCVLLKRVPQGRTESGGIVLAASQGPVAGADQAPGPHSHSSSACLDDRVSDTRAKRTRRWHISKSTSHGACDGDVTLAAGVSRRGARTRRCSRAAAAV